MYPLDPREAMKQLCEAAAGETPFPPPSSGRLLCDAIEALKQDDADEAELALAEELSVLLYRHEVATWARKPDEPRNIRAAIAAQLEKLAEEATSRLTPSFNDFKVEQHYGDSVAIPQPFPVSYPF